MENLRLRRWIYENKDNCDFGFNHLAAVLVIQDSAMVKLQIFFWKIIMSQIIFMVGLLAVGLALGFLAAKLKKKS